MPPNIVDLNDYQIDEWPSTEEGEARQAQQVSEFYQCVYAHPEVEALIWWDLQDGGWLGAPSGLVREDMTPKPAYHALKQLIKRDWWYSQGAPKRNKDGSLSIYGPEGSYELSVGDRTVGFTLEKDSPRVEI